MEMFTTHDGMQIFFKHWGSGQALAFHHGWPLSGDDWGNQMLFFLKRGFRKPFPRQMPPRTCNELRYRC